MDVLVWHQWLFAAVVAWLAVWTAWGAAGALVRARAHRRAADEPPRPPASAEPAGPGR